jgi:hypothetical protein
MMNKPENHTLNGFENSFHYESVKKIKAGVVLHYFQKWIT